MTEASDQNGTPVHVSVDPLSNKIISSLKDLSMLISKLENDRAANEAVTLDIDELERSMIKSIKGLNKKHKNEDPCIIYKAYNSVRCKHAKDYTPEIIAIGPYHHDNEALKPMEEVKWRYLRDLLRRNSRKNKIHHYISLIGERLTEVRSYYPEPVVPDDNTFVQMMVLDGCFLIEYLVKAYLGDNLTQLNEVSWQLPLMRNDLLLLENQLPFPVLKMLFDKTDIPILLEIKKDGSPVTLLNLVVSYVSKNEMETLPEEPKQKEEVKPDFQVVAESIPEVPDETTHEETTQPKPRTVHHLLHAYHASLRPPPSFNQARSSFWMTTVKMIGSLLKRIGSLLNAVLLFILSCFLCGCHLRLNCCGLRAKDIGKEKRAPRGIPTATQLEDSGIKLKKKEGTKYMLAVTFHKESGVLEIPMVSIQEATISQFRNLIAFEQCFPESGTYFTSHATFMNNLIDTPMDVAVLSDNHIIESKLGKNEDVAEFFNHLCDGAFLSFETHHHVQIFKDVDQYCNVNRHKWRAALVHNYFANPWAIISLIAAVFLLLLTALQTFYTVFPYYTPRNNG